MPSVMVSTALRWVWAAHRARRETREPTQVQEKAAKAEEKRKKQVAAQEAKAVKEKERLAKEQLERERQIQADKS